MRRIEQGDVVALAVDGVKNPPVGAVIDADDGAILLGLYSFVTNHFTAGQLLVRRADVRATMWAEQEDEDDDGTIVWDMRPLGSFQSRWKT